MVLLQRYPKLDLRASNNIVHIRTCSDTCSALAELIKYIASDGDLVPQEGSERDAASTSSQVHRQGIDAHSCVGS